MTLCSFAKSWLKYYRDNAELKNSPPGRTGKGFLRGKRMEMPSGERSYGGGCGTKKQHPPEELGRDFQEGSGWKCLPGRTVMEGGAEL